MTIRRNPNAGTSAESGAIILADLVERGGGTYESRTYIPFAPKDGFAVRIGGIRLPIDQVDGEKALWALSHVYGEFATSFVGTWADEDWVYFDAVRYFGAGRRDDAREAGWKAGQTAIYDFGTQQAVLTAGAEWDS